MIIPKYKPRLQHTTWSSAVRAAGTDILQNYLSNKKPPKLALARANTDYLKGFEFRFLLGLLTQNYLSGLL